MFPTKNGKNRISLQWLLLALLLPCIAFAQDGGAGAPVTPAVESVSIFAQLLSFLASPVVSTSLGILLWEAFVGANSRIPANSTLGLFWAMIKAIGGAIVKAKESKPPTAGLLLIFLPMMSCAHYTPPNICGTGKHTAPPVAQACAEQFAALVKTIPGAVAACSVGFNSACINAVMDSGIDLYTTLTACLPTCAPDSASARRDVGAPLRVDRSVLQNTVIDSLRCSGYPDAGK